MQDLRRYRLEVGVTAVGVAELSCANLWASSVRERTPSLL